MEYMKFNVIDFFDRIYNSINNKNVVLERSRINSFFRFLIRMFANIFLPVYFALTYNNRKYCISQNRERNNRIIISLTSFPTRIGKVWIVIESILRQSHKPDMIILWLSKEQFNSKDVLPKRLLQQQNKGLQIRFCEDDLKSHKKYFYILKEYPEDILITVDDDIIYKSSMIEELVILHHKTPDAICCNRAQNIKVTDGEISSYNQWEELKYGTGADKCVFFTSGGGTLFPPRSLHYEALNFRAFKEICFYADDVWLNCMARLNNTKILKSNYYSCLLPIMYFKNSNLNETNVKNKGNDSQIRATREYLIDNYNIDPFKQFVNH